MASARGIQIIKLSPATDAASAERWTQSVVTALVDEEGEGEESGGGATHRLAWNLTGTLLTACRRDEVRMYRQAYLGEWKRVGSVGLE